ncbi:MAG: tyrosine--tRNA ligase [Patescibacteria group bacterium]
MKIITDAKKITDCLTRGVDSIYPSQKKLKTKMRAGKRITLYLGVDPTGFELHIGHSVALRKLKHFQELGHKVILLIGDFTGQIGDPTGKDKTRQPLTVAEVLANAKDYKQQASRILDFENQNNPIEIKFNSHWLSKMTFQDVVTLASNFTVQQMLERDMFERRIKGGLPIGLHEFLYPLMQGYDSVAMNVDLEVGGTDQIFNMLAGRTLQSKINKKEKFVLAVPLLTDSSGKKIGKTEGNVIAINAKPEDLYGKIMAMGDDTIIKTFELCTDIALKQIADMANEMKKGKNPKIYKAKLAYEIVKLYNSEAVAKKAEDEFNKIFQKKDKPSEIEIIKIKNNIYTAPELLLALKLAPSKTGAKRLVEMGGVKINDVKVDNWQKELSVQEGDIVQVGKRKFIKIKF